MVVHLYHEGCMYLVGVGGGDSRFLEMDSRSSSVDSRFLLFQFQQGRLQILTSRLLVDPGLLLMHKTHILQNPEYLVY